MIIAGLTGSIHHGKTTFAGLLADQAHSALHFESWELIAEVAGALHREAGSHPDPADLDAVNDWLLPLPEIVDTYMHTPVKYADIRLTPARLQKHPEHYQKLLEYLADVQADAALIDTDITADTKEQFRPLLQWLGGFLVIVAGPGIWYDEIVRRLNNLRTQGYELVTIGGVRYPGDAERLRNAGGIILQIERPALPETDSTDLTERQRSLIKPDAVIMNDGSLEDLAERAEAVYKDLCFRQLKPEYGATAVA